jgi:hypothetical protein
VKRGGGGREKGREREEKRLVNVKSSYSSGGQKRPPFGFHGCSVLVTEGNKEYKPERKGGGGREEKLESSILLIFYSSFSGVRLGSLTKKNIKKPCSFIVYKEDKQNDRTWRREKYFFPLQREH